MDHQQYADLVLRRLMTAPAGGGHFGDHMSLENWEWPTGVAVYAMMKIYRATGDGAILREIEGWFNRQIERGLPSRNINTVCPMLTLTLLYRETGEERWRPLILSWAEWVMTALPRTEEGGFQHITAVADNDGQLWDDTLFMTVLFLYQAGEALGRPEWCEEAKYQFLLHIKYLREPESELWYHGWTFKGRHHFGRALWARGNSWFTCGAVDFIEWLPESDPVRRFVLHAWQAQCRALCRLQDGATGLWHTLLNRPDSYLETSASAAMAYGLLKGTRLGLLPEECACAGRRALAGVLAMVDTEGTVQGVSYGTAVGDTEEDYLTVPVQPTAYGQGLTFLMLTEVLGEEGGV